MLSTPSLQPVLPTAALSRRPTNSSRLSKAYQPLVSPHGVSVGRNHEAHSLVEHVDLVLLQVLDRGPQALQQLADERLALSHLCPSVALSLTAPGWPSAMTRSIEALARMESCKGCGTEGQPAASHATARAHARATADWHDRGAEGAGRAASQEGQLSDGP